MSEENTQADNEDELLRALRLILALISKTSTPSVGVLMRVGGIPSTSFAKNLASRRIEATHFATS
jgi:hypothetical protein